MTRAGILAHFQGATIMLVTVGYALFAAVSAAFSLPSTPIAIAVRGAAGAFCVVAWFVARRSFVGKLDFWLIATAVLFWILYLCRIAYDTYWYPQLLMYESSTYWVWGVGGCLIPMLCLYFTRFPDELALTSRHWSLAAAFLACSLALTSLSTFVADAYGSYDTGRAGLSTLNPISLGHLGVQLILLAIWRLYFSSRQITAWTIVIGVCAIALGGFITLSANSRGPLVALVAALLFAVGASSGRRKYLVLAAMLVGALSLPYLAALIDSVAGTAIFDRMFGQSQLDDINTQSRFHLYESAADLFLRQPFYGSGLEDPHFGGYPHNLMIEAFMATGLLGGVLFAAMIILAIATAYRLLREKSGFGWVALLLIQQIIAVQFSGSLVQSTILWALTGVVGSVAGSSRTAVRTQVANSYPAYRHPARVAVV